MLLSVSADPQRREVHHGVAHMRVLDVVGAAITLVVLLAVPTVASAATKTVQAGPPGSQTAQFQDAFGDANNFFRKVTTIHKGDSVKWKINGFHNVLFPQAGVEVPALIVPDPSSLVTGVLDAATPRSGSTASRTCRSTRSSRRRRAARPTSRASSSTPGCRPRTGRRPRTS